MKNVSKEKLQISSQFGFMEGFLSLFSFKDNVYSYLMKNRMRNEEELTVNIREKTTQALYENWKKVGGYVRHGMNVVDQERQESHGEEEQST